ncbi:50S ribosomal protein L11 [Candidatus Nomurabacteria bacterium RIFCSPHIGHO2_01_FULL_39_9]|uniref:Large ribosomal subunit protein uL11 n=1 Tax=Candidatus Nomurabacteria bacterium RIFCSPHIGHO2_01_FULL_39_9 TaxID=1801735 RepID=A0A1F6UY55_9BACT|nr:MAG: 50S ribosomal protein L11 [Candidatus Nomurabacteria bacterium RIFCSPHIGHO2_01_FULL_39_9]
MAKKLIKKVKLMVPAGKATPAPPLGPTLGQAGVNIGDFVNKFNAATKDMVGTTVRVALSVYEDRSYDFVVKGAPMSELIKKTAGIEKGSGKNITSKAGKLTKAQVKQIAEQKMADLTANDIEAAMKIVEGQARSMGVEIV